MHLLWVCIKIFSPACFLWWQPTCFVFGSSVNFLNESWDQICSPTSLFSTAKAFNCDCNNRQYCWWKKTGIKCGFSFCKISLFSLKRKRRTSFTKWWTAYEDSSGSAQWAQSALRVTYIRYFTESTTCLSSFVVPLPGLYGLIASLLIKQCIRFFSLIGT